jgi:hypothetical protein
MDTDDFIQIYEGTKKNKKPTKRKLVFDDKKEKVSKFDLQRFNALVDELDNAIKKCFREFYEQFLSSFDLFFKSVPSKG